MKCQIFCKKYGLNCIKWRESWSSNYFEKLCWASPPKINLKKKFIAQMHFGVVSFCFKSKLFKIVLCQVPRQSFSSFSTSLSFFTGQYFIGEKEALITHTKTFQNFFKPNLILSAKPSIFKLKFKNLKPEWDNRFHSVFSMTSNQIICPLYFSGNKNPPNCTKWFDFWFNILKKLNGFISRLHFHYLSTKLQMQSSFYLLDHSLLRYI